MKIFLDSFLSLEPSHASQFLSERSLDSSFLINSESVSLNRLCVFTITPSNLCFLTNLLPLRHLFEKSMTSSLPQRIISLYFSSRSDHLVVSEKS